MFVVAAAGAKTAKHGGRSVSSKSGSADVVEALGGNIHLTPEQIARSIEEVGIGFMFAPNHHPAMKNVAPVRRELGIKTIFNILGPLTNPAGAPNILMGVFHPDLVGIQVRALQRLGAEHALVVYGRDGMDEISLGAATVIGELKNGEITEYEIHPEDFGMVMASNRALKVDTPEQSMAMLMDVLDNVAGAGFGALLRDFLEVRGLGVLNIRTIFGEAALRPRKNVKIVVHLERPSGSDPTYLDRLPLKPGTESLMDVEIRKVTIPVAAGRNLAVLTEAAVRNHVLQMRGIDSTREFVERQAQAMQNSDD